MGLHHLKRTLLRILYCSNESPHERPLQIVRRTSVIVHAETRKSDLRLVPSDRFPEGGHLFRGLVRGTSPHARKSHPPHNTALDANPLHAPESLQHFPPWTLHQNDANLAFAPKVIHPLNLRLHVHHAGALHPFPHC
ncbi:hypothetical protein M501DRAFT_1004463 [Patellaria atrata CBS 101060]|uniref:Uncharacterized protein n=1 Tax=Patellaria atrata CBS 101060 TaxID=1346257 RepID=A0A9P4SA43_9PEZI|nr:hypothetical protein M501DRAFT_1004463 [Patellaria atrata CBS 101060]